jgi:hypothetical protein
MAKSDTLTAETHEYLFDVPCTVTFRIKAATEQEARAFIAENVNGTEANFGAYPDGEPILSEVSAHTSKAHLVSVDDD